MMRPGSLPQKILHEIRRNGAKVVLRSRLSRFGGYDQVGHALRRLEREGLLEKLGRGVWLALEPEARPVGIRNLTWSNPEHAPVDAVIANHLARPLSEDLRKLALAYGPRRLRAGLARLRAENEISPAAVRIADRWLSDIERGFAHAARQLAARQLAA